MRLVYFCIFELFLSDLLVGQKRYLVSPHDEVIPLKRNVSAASVIAMRRRWPTPTAADACGTTFTFGYPEDIYPVNTDFGAYHNDVMGEWFVAKANGRIDTIYWEALGSVGARDSTLHIRIHNSRIGPDYGPGVRTPGSPWPPPCQNWGYFVNTNDEDQGVAAFPEDATPPGTSSWISTIASGPPTRPPLLNPLINCSLAVIDHANSINFVALTDAGQSLNVKLGQKFFISMKVKGDHPVGGAPNIRTSFSAHGRTVPRTDELYPSRNWKFYEHDSGPFPTCAGIPVNNVKRGWVARGGFGPDTLDVAVFNFWYSMVVTTNVPPRVHQTEAIRSTFDRGDQVFDAVIVDCDPEHPERAGLKMAVVKWQVNGVPQPDRPMVNVGGDSWEATIPGQRPSSRVNYKVYAEDSSGAFSYGVPITYAVIQANNEYVQIDTAGPCIRKSIHSTGTVIPQSSFFLPPGAHPPATASNDGTAGPFDMGGNMRLFGDRARYVWVGVDGAIAMSKDPFDTVDVNDGGSYNSNYTFPYSGSLRRGGRCLEPGPCPMPGNFIAPLWSDLWYGDDITTCGKIIYQNGYKGDTCMYIVEWDSVGFWSGSIGQCDETTFRVILNRCDGTIEYQYDNLGTLGEDTSAVIGLEAGSTVLNVPNPVLNTQPPHILINELGYPLATRPSSGWCVKIYQATVTTSNAGWNLVSVGVLPVRGNYSKTALYPTATSAAIPIWPSFGYGGVSTLRNGLGYWMKFPSGQNVGARGALLHHVVDTVRAGWNMIGTIGFPVAISSIVVSGTTVTSQYWEYTGAYHSLNTPPKPLIPGRGFWVKAAGNGTLTIDGNVPAAEPKHVPQTTYAELNSITIRDNAGRFQTLYLGEELMVKEPLSFHELPPASMEFDARFASQRMLEIYPAHLSANAAYAYPIQIEASEYPLTLSWNTVQPADRKLVLTGADGKLGNTILDGSGSVKLTNVDLKRLVITLKDVAVPKAFALGQNYPNPFNPKTDLRYQVADGRFVSVDVYDILGRKVATLVNEEKPTGYYTIEWDGRDAHGMSVPTGIYFVRMTAGDFNAARKILLMK